MNDHMNVDDPRVAAILAAAAAPAEGPVPGETAALAAFRSVYRPRRRFGMPRYSEKAKLIAAAVFGGVVVISGAATAATGSLPLVSHGHSHSHPTPQTPGAGDDQSGDTGDETGTTTDTPDTSQPDNHGSDVSGVAKDHTGDATAGNHGKVVCAEASAGKCVTQGQSAGHRQNGSDTHGNAHQNTNSATHRQNGLTTHGKAHVNTNAATHRQNTLTTHGKAGQNGHTSG